MSLKYHYSYTVRLFFGDPGVQRYGGEAAKENDLDVSPNPVNLSSN